MKPKLRNTDWMYRYESDLRKLEKIRSATLVSLPKKPIAELNRVVDELASAFENPDVVKRFADAWWRHFGKSEIAAAKKEAAVRNRLAPLLRRLQKGTEEDWEAYARLAFRARLFATTPLLAMFGKRAEASAAPVTAAPAAPSDAVVTHS